MVVIADVIAELRSPEETLRSRQDLAVEVNQVLNCHKARSREHILSNAAK